jgi:hypothetical protein
MEFLVSLRALFLSLFLFRRSIVMECRGPLGAHKDQVILLFRPMASAAENARQWLSHHFAEADCSAGLPKTLRQPSLILARCLDAWRTGAALF